jgi:hypothetical protein
MDETTMISIPGEVEAFVLKHVPDSVLFSYAPRSYSFKLAANFNQINCNLLAFFIAEMYNKDGAMYKVNVKCEDNARAHVIRQRNPDGMMFAEIPVGAVIQHDYTLYIDIEVTEPLPMPSRDFLCEVSLYQARLYKEIAQSMGVPPKKYIEGKDD